MYLGTYQGLTLEVDTTLQLLNFGMKILFEVKCLSVSTISCMPKSAHEQLRDVPAPRFRSRKSTALTSQSEIQEYLPFIEADNGVTHDRDAPSSSTSTLESSTGNTLEFSSHKNYILSHFYTSLKIEKKQLDGDLMCLSGDWCGNGFVSGLEVTMSLSSIEVISQSYLPSFGQWLGVFLLLILARCSCSSVLSLQFIGTASTKLRDSPSASCFRSCRK